MKVKTLKISRRDVTVGDTYALAGVVDTRTWNRVVRKTKEHYRLLIWIAEQYSNALFLDLGTRDGASALSLAYNPSNRVISYDVSPEARLRRNFDFSDFENIEFRIQDVSELTVDDFNPASVIFLDISHSSEPERAVLEVLDESQFKGILIMDDVKHWRFPKLRELWEEIDRPKLIIPFAHSTGTGIVSYGPKMEIVE
jgi:predicted O-methyltransferase YrrM